MLEKLTKAFGVSGMEDDVREIIENEIKNYCDEITTDSIGNLICFKKGTDDTNKKIMISAHMDEVGFIITEITNVGYLCFKSIGGIDPRVLISKKVIVGANRILGVIGAKPPHLEKEKSENAASFKDLYIDIGAKNMEEAKSVIGIGDYACFQSDYVEFGNNLIKSKALDDRIGCNILLELAKNTFPDDIYYTFTVQEEVGCRGAGVAAYGIEPDFAIIVEATTCSDIPGTDAHSFSTKLGNGAALSILDSGSYSNKELTNAMLDTANKHNIKVQFKQTTLGGNDASTIHVSGVGIKTAVISVPCRYIHSPSSVANKDDIKSCFDILYNFLKEAGSLSI